MIERRMRRPGPGGWGGGGGRGRVCNVRVGKHVKGEGEGGGGWKGGCRGRKTWGEWGGVKERRRKVRGVSEWEGPRCWGRLR